MSSNNTPWVCTGTQVHSKDGALIAQCGDFQYRQKRSHEEANAKLIASAPDLLEALEMLRFKLDNHLPLTPSDKNQVAKAIAKAKS